MFRSSNKIINSGLSFPRSPPLAVFAWPGSALHPLRIVNDLLLAQANEITTINGQAWRCDTQILFLFCNDQIQNLLVIGQISPAYIANGWNIFHRVVVFLHWVITGDIRWHYESFEEILLVFELRVVLGHQCKHHEFWPAKHSQNTHHQKKNRPPAAGRFLITYLFDTLLFFGIWGIMMICNAKLQINCKRPYRVTYGR